MCDATILLTNVHKLSLSTRPYRHFLFNALDCSLKRSGTASSFVFHSFDRLQQGCHICHHHLEKTEHCVQPHPSSELEIEEGQQNKPQMTDIMEYLRQQSYYYDNITNEEVQYLVVFCNKCICSCNLYLKKKHLGLFIL